MNHQDGAATSEYARHETLDEKRQAVEAIKARH
jgi:hypothetical protein